MSNVIIIENKYGSVTLTPVTEYMPVKEISVKSVPVINECMFSMAKAEEIALITGNRGVQVSFPFLTDQTNPNYRCGYLIHHNSTYTACVCQVDIKLTQIAGGLSAEEEIARIYETSGVKLQAQIC